MPIDGAAIGDGLQLGGGIHLPLVPGKPRLPRRIIFGREIEFQRPFAAGTDGQIQAKLIRLAPGQVAGKMHIVANPNIETLPPKLLGLVKDRQALVRPALDKNT
jgi:hypothetical protein